MDLKMEGIVTTIVGDGSIWKRNNKATWSKMYQHRLGPIGGIPWAVTIHDGLLYFSSLEQGYVARIIQGKVEHLADGLNMPMVMTFLNGKLYIPEYGANRIRVISPHENTILMEAQVKNPMAIHSYNGLLYIVDTGNHRILEYNPRNFTYQVIAGTGKPGYEEEPIDARESHLYFPIDIDIKDDVMIIADGMNNRLRALNLSRKAQQLANIIIAPGYISTVAGNGKRCTMAKDSLSPCNPGFSGDGFQARDAILSWPFAPRFDSKKRIWFIDANNNRIRTIDVDGNIQTVAGVAPIFPQGYRYSGSKGKDIGDGLPSIEADFNRPMDMCLIEKDFDFYDIVVSDTDNNKIRMIQDYHFIPKQ